MSTNRSSILVVFSLWSAALALGVAGCSGGSELNPIGEGSWADTRVCSSSSVVMGIDVSHYQTVTSWANVASSGIGFAIMKATEGVTYTDPDFAKSWANSKAAGVVRGAYCFFHSTDDPVTEADFFVNTVGPLSPGDMLVLDLEVTDGNSGATVAADALAWLNRVQADTGVTPIVYTSPSFFDSTLGGPAGFSSFPIWIANWMVSCPYIPTAWSTWHLWQDTDSVTVPGITGAPDGDEFNGTTSDLSSWAKSLGGPAAPTPDASVPATADAGIHHRVEDALVPGVDAGASTPPLDATAAGTPDAGGTTADLGTGGANDLPGQNVVGGCSQAGSAPRGALPGLLGLLLVAGLLGVERRRGSRRGPVSRRSR